MNAEDEFIAGEGRLAAVLAAMPFFGQPWKAAAHFLPFMPRSR
jgi:hypothetical protein